MNCITPRHRSKLEVKVTRDQQSGRKVVMLDKTSHSRIKSWNATACLYVVVRFKAIQYVGCSTKDFFKRFTYGLQQAHAKGYRWPTTNGQYQLFVWKMDGGRSFVEAVEAEVAFLQRAVLGDWPLELNQISPKRHVVQPEASAYGKTLAFGIYAWLVEKKHVYADASDVGFLAQLRARSIIC